MGKVEGDAVSDNRLLVTGADWFLGSNLYDTLLSQGKVVIGLHNFYNGGPAYVTRLLARPGFQMLRHDVGDAFGGEFDEARQRRPDISFARAGRGWMPAVRLRKGLELTAAHFKQVIAVAFAEATQ